MVLINRITWTLVKPASYHHLQNIRNTLKNVFPLLSDQVFINKKMEICLEVMFSTYHLVVRR